MAQAVVATSFTEIAKKVGKKVYEGAVAGYTGYELGKVGRVDQAPIQPNITINLPSTNPSSTETYSSNGIVTIIAVVVSVILALFILKSYFEKFMKKLRGNREVSVYQASYAPQQAFPQQQSSFAQAPIHANI